MKYSFENLKDYIAMEPIINPILPYVGKVEGGLIPGKMVKVQGKTSEGADRFAINYQLGPGLNPRDDIALHIAPRFQLGCITRNSIESMQWGSEENDGPMWITAGQPFEIIILCEYNCYKIAVNGRHFTEFNHRLPYNKVTHLTIDGDVEINSIFYEIIQIGSRPSAPVPDIPPVDVGPPPPGGLYPTINPKHKYEPPPADDNPPRAYGYKHQKSEENDAFGSCLDKVGLAVGGLVAAGGVAAAMHAINKQKQKHGMESDHERSSAKESESGFGGLGALGTVLANSLAANSHAQQGYPPDQSGGMLGSILGSLAGGGNQPNYRQQPQGDQLSGALGSILGGVLSGGGGRHQQPTYQPSGGYGSNPQSFNTQGGGGNDIVGEIGGALFKSAMDGLSKHMHKSRLSEQDVSGGSYNNPYQAPSYNPQSTNFNPQAAYYGNVAPPSTPQPLPPAAPSGSAGKLSAAEISKGLGLGDDED